MRYVFKIWLFTIIVSPLLLALILGAIINDSSFTSILNSYEIIFVMIIVGFLSSIPAMAIFWLIKRFLKNKYSSVNEKIILSIYSFLSVWITFFIVDSGFITRWSEQTIWVLIYSLTIVVGVWIFKNDNKEITE
jgi:cyanate permease|tara:strand:- start:90 stop:491 length:402 start_codon:yes stop_codon:yes gene_type:complete